MGQILHGSARTTAAVRRAIQNSQESLRVLAKRHGINPKTVAKWRQRRTPDDRKTGPKEPRSTVLTIEEEAIVVAFRQHTLLPLDDCLYALRAATSVRVSMLSKPLTRTSLKYPISARWANPSASFASVLLGARSSARAA